MNINLTIFTPTYNRAHTLGRLYESLKGQTFKNFEWLIIDDGSTDNTENLINVFISENSIPIKYIKQANAGKQAAWNNAVLNARGKFFCGIDSDDIIHDNLVIEDLFNNYIGLLDESQVAIRGLAISKKHGKASASAFDCEILIQSWEDEIKSNKIGDRNDIWLLKVLKNNLYPVSLDIKFIPEIWLYAHLNLKGYKFIYINKPIILIYDDHQNNRLSQQILEKNVLGQYLARSEVLKSISLKTKLYNPVYFIKNFIRYSQTANILKVNFNQRLKDIGLLFSFISYFFMVWFKK